MLWTCVPSPLLPILSPPLPPHQIMFYSFIINWIPLCTVIFLLIVDLNYLWFRIPITVWSLDQLIDHRSSVPIGSLPMRILTHFLIMFCAYGRGSLQCWMLRAYLNISNPHSSVRLCVLLCPIQRCVAMSVLRASADYVRTTSCMPCCQKLTHSYLTQDKQPVNYCLYDFTYSFLAYSFYWYLHSKTCLRYEASVYITIRISFWSVSFDCVVIWIFLNYHVILSPWERCQVLYVPRGRYVREWQPVWRGRVPESEWRIYVWCN